MYDSISDVSSTSIKYLAQYCYENLKQFQIKMCSNIDSSNNNTYEKLF